jgi:hypothetical protein
MVEKMLLLIKASFAELYRFNRGFGGGGMTIAVLFFFGSNEAQVTKLDSLASRSGTKMTLGMASSPLLLLLLPPSAVAAAESPPAVVPAPPLLAPPPPLPAAPVLLLKNRHWRGARWG